MKNIIDISRNPPQILVFSMSSSLVNRIRHDYCRFQGQNHPLAETPEPLLVHMVILRPSSLLDRADLCRQSWWPWLVFQACTLWHCRARAAATGPGSLCQLVPDLSVSQSHSQVCHGGCQRWHEVLIRLRDPHPPLKVLVIQASSAMP